MLQPDIAGIRKNYSSKTLSETDMVKDPVIQFDTWWKEAMDSDILEVNAMTLATASADGLPSARIVLLKGYSTEGFVFYSNYDSYKGRQLAENPRACLVFLWKELERQVRITGVVQKLSEAESAAYFRSRPVKSQIGAAVSPQSQVIDDRAWLEQRFEKLEQEVKEGDIPKPANWGGYRVVPVEVEFWQGRRSRLHDRIQYSLEENGSWKMERLAP